MSSQYKRTFVTLKQGNSNYTLMGEAMGRCIIESRGSQGKISFLVQNLKPEIMYKAYIIANKDVYSYGVPLGSISVDKRGKGELKKIFNTYNVEDTGLSIENFKIAVILVNEKSEIVDPLVGYIGKEISWKNNFKKHKKAEEDSMVKNDLSNVNVSGQEEVKEQIEEIEKEVEEQIEEIEKEVEEQIEEIERNLQLQSAKKDTKKENTKNNSNTIHSLNGNEIHNTLKSMAEEVNKELTEFKYYALMTEEQVKEPSTNMDEINNYRINNNLEYVFLNNTKMVPFKRQSKNVEWVRISLKEMVYLPIDFWYLSNEAFIVSCYKRYKHLILGLLNEKNEKEYLLGVPDMYKSSMNVRASALGFNQFKCCDDIRLEENSHGYWIMPIVTK